MYLTFLNYRLYPSNHLLSEAHNTNSLLHEPLVARSGSTIQTYLVISRSLWSKREQGKYVHQFSFNSHKFTVRKVKKLIDTKSLLTRQILENLKIDRILRELTVPT